MTGNFTLTLPVMLAVGVAVGLSKRMTYGTIYTTKLLRRGVDIAQPPATSPLPVVAAAVIRNPPPKPVGNAEEANPEYPDHKAHPADGDTRSGPT